MKQIPILFSTPMVQAILKGRKTQTRRVMKPQPDENGVSYMPNAPLYWEETYREEWKPWKWDTEQGESFSKFCPYGQPGDILWVRESCARGLFDEFYYKADGANYVKWKPSIHMPKAACRIFLKIKSIRVERLQDISPGDAMDEGLEYCNVDMDAFEGGEFVADYKNYTWRDDESYEDYFFPSFANPIDSFRTLWQSINGTESWNANPWVWVVTFKRCEKPESFGK